MTGAASSAMLLSVSERQIRYQKVLQLVTVHWEAPGAVKSKSVSPQ